jgi:hypothetical protein
MGMCYAERPPGVGSADGGGGPQRGTLWLPTMGISRLSANPRSWLFLCTALLLGVPLAFLAGMLISEERLDGVTVRTSPVLIPVVEEVFEDQRRVQVALSWKEGATLPAPAWSGVVTSLHIGRGDKLATGTSLISINGVDRLAAATPAPFHRSLRLGDRGADVAALNRFLVRLGHAADLSDSSIFTTATAEAVEDLSRQIGLARATDVFDPAWLVWIPHEPFVVAKVLPSVGSPAPAPGTPVAAGFPTLVGARVKNLAGGPAHLENAGAYRLKVGATTLRIWAKSLRLLPRDLPPLARAVRPLAAETKGLLLRAEPLRAVAVPTTAVMSGRDGDLCVWVASSKGFSPMAVDAIGAEGGVTRVTPGRLELKSVLANPTDVLHNPLCPSG